MITILKIPIYLAVETGNVDRLKVTRAMQKEIIPQFVKQIAERQPTFTSEEVRSLQNQMGPFSCRFMTDVEAMAKTDDKKVEHKPKSYLS